MQLVDKRELRQHCINEGMYQHMPFIDKWVSLTACEKADIEFVAHMNITLDNCDWLATGGTTWGRIKLFFKRISPWHIHKMKWYRAVEFFWEYEEKEMARVYERMGLPKNGIRPDDC